MKRILIFIESLQCGGAEKSLISLLPTLDYSQYEVDLLLIKRGGVFEPYVPKQVHILDFCQQAHPLVFRCYQTLFSLRLRWNRLIHRHEHAAETRWRTMRRAYTPFPKYYDIAIAYQQGFPTYFIATKVNADKKKAWVNVDLKEAGYNPLFNRPFYLQFDTIVAVSSNLQQIIAKDGFVPLDKTIIKRDILNETLIRQMATQIPFKKPTAKLTLVTVGRLVYQKGYDIAVETAAILRQKNLDFHWLFVGDGDMRAYVENLIRAKHLDDCISLLGEQANPYPFMATADIYVQTSRFEGFGLTIAEAKILNKPIVSTNFSVVYDQITDGENGLIAEMNPESIAQQILRMYEHLHDHMPERI